MAVAMVKVYLKKWERWGVFLRVQGETNLYTFLAITKVGHALDAC